MLLPVIPALFVASLLPPSFAFLFHTDKINFSDVPSPLTRLIYENGSVQGVEYEFKGETHRELGPVVLATGGYAADFE